MIKCFNYSWGVKLFGLLFSLCPITAISSDEISGWVSASIESNAKTYSGLALDIWERAELGYHETQSSEALQNVLAEAGFDVESGVAGMPTAFVATFGGGYPKIGMLAEFDALPGMSQKAIPVREALRADGAGHACGHHLFGAGSVAAAITVAESLKKTGKNGTIRVYGSPAEEGGAGKVYMVREGLFDDLDVALHWHSADRNAAANRTSLANISAKFRFHGRASHAAMSPEHGRSALDGVEAMNDMVNMLREHVPSDTRIHYVITSGGDAPNVVPHFAEVFYYVRSGSAEALAPVWERVKLAAQGAALGTETTLEYEVVHGSHSLLPNTVLTAAVHGHLAHFGGVDYTESELEFAHEIRKTLSLKSGKPGVEAASNVLPYTDKVYPMSGSTDVGDVSWNVPTAGLYTATWVPGTPPHSWQAVAAGGTQIGVKGMLLASKVLARAALSLFDDHALVEAASKEFENRRGPGYVYKPLVGDREPPLDYRVH